MYKLALIQTSPLVYHVWSSMQQTPLKIIYALPNMSCPTLWELWTCTCATIGPMVMAFMAILTPLWETTQKIIIQLLAMYSCLLIAQFPGHPVNKRPLPKAHLQQSTWPWPMWPTKLSGTVVS